MPSEIESLIQAGRHDLAATAVQRLTARGLPPGEVLLDLGRWCEKAGKTREAAAAYRAAARDGSVGASAGFSLAGLLHRAGKGGQARRALQDAARRTRGESQSRAENARDVRLAWTASPQLRELMGSSACRSAFFSGIRRQDGGLTWLAAALRRELSYAPGDASLRHLLTQTLIAARRWKALSSAQGQWSKLEGCWGQWQWRETVLQLINGSRYGPGLERQVLRSLRRAPVCAEFAVTGHRLFSALLCAGRYEAAFRLGETWLHRSEGIPDPQSLAWPWWYKVPRPAASERFLRVERQRLNAAARAGRFPHWFAFCRSILLTHQGRRREALAQYAAIRRRQAPRYLFMRQPFVVLKLDLEAAAPGWVLRTCRDLIRRAPGQWELRCRMAESYLALGRRQRAYAEFRRAARSTGSLAEQRAVETWHGEALLWAGRYRLALKRFDAAIAQGATVYAHAWRGAAYMKLGRRRDALRDLDRACRLDPQDPETRLWRGELLRLMGKFPEALRELRPAIRAGFHWGLYNRALVRHALGDLTGQEADFAAIPKVETAFLRRRLGLPAAGALGAEDMRRALDAGLALAKGVRRSEAFLRCLWMRRD